MFKDENIRRRFNVAACLGKEWLPPGYGKTEYSQLTPVGQHIVDSFEGKESYQNCLGQPLFSPQNKLLLKAA